MKASKFTDAQKAFVIKQCEQGAPVAEICRKAGISQTTYFNWKKRHASLLPTEMRRLRELEDENSGLKKIVADLPLDRETPQAAPGLRAIPCRTSIWLTCAAPCFQLRRRHDQRSSRSRACHQPSPVVRPVSRRDCRHSSPGAFDECSASPIS